MEKKSVVQGLKRGFSVVFGVAGVYFLYKAIYGIINPNLAGLLGLSPWYEKYAWLISIVLFITAICFWRIGKDNKDVKI